MKKEYITDIKTNLSLADDNLGYKHGLDWKDEDIKYYLSKKQLFGLDMTPQYRSKFRADFDRGDRGAIIDYFNKKMRPLCPSELEFIPRKYWCKFEELRGANLNNLSHPIFRLGHQIIKDNFKKNSDTILIQACGNMKPYIDNPAYAHGLKFNRKGKCDLFISSWNLTPVDFTPFFPWRYYEWNHALETPFMTNLCIQNEVYNIVDLVDYFDYKKIVLWGPGKPDYFYVELFKRLKKVIPNKELIFVLDEENSKILVDKMSGSWGMAKARYYSPKEIVSKVESYLEEEKPQECYGLADEKQIEYLKLKPGKLTVNEQLKLI